MVNGSFHVSELEKILDHKMSKDMVLVVMPNQDNIEMIVRTNEKISTNITVTLTHASISPTCGPFGSPFISKSSRPSYWIFVFKTDKGDTNAAPSSVDIYYENNLIFISNISVSSKACGLIENDIHEILIDGKFNGTKLYWNIYERANSTGMYDNLLTKFKQRFLS